MERRGGDTSDLPPPGTQGYFFVDYSPSVPKDGDLLPLLKMFIRLQSPPSIKVTQETWFRNI